MPTVFRDEQTNYTLFRWSDLGPRSDDDQSVETKDDEETIDDDTNYSLFKRSDLRPHSDEDHSVCTSDDKDCRPQPISANVQRYKGNISDSK